MSIWVELVLPFFAMIVFLPVVFAIHELGHAIMAWLVGFRVFRFQLGVGKSVVSFSIGGTLVSAAWRPGGGVWSARSTVVGWKWRKLMITAAGPALSAVVGVGLLVFALTTTRPHMQAVLIGLFGVMNLIELTNLIPSNKRATDGGNLLRVFRGSPQEIQDMMLAHLGEEAKCLIENENPRGPHRAREFQSLAPQHPNGPLLLGSWFMQQQDFDGARGQFVAGLELLARSDFDLEKIQQATLEIQQAIAECEAAG